MPCLSLPPRSACGADEKSTALEFVMRNLPAGVECFEANARPLPTMRRRILFFQPGQVGHAFAKLSASMPAHCCHMKHFLGELEQQDSQQAPSADAASDAKMQSEYADYYARALQKAIDCNKLPGDVYVPSASLRRSAKLKFGPWMSAQIDVYDLMRKSAMTRTVGDEEEHDYVIADVSQSTNRGSMTRGGKIPTLTTASRLFCFEPGKAGLITAEDCFKLHGHTCNSNWSWAGLSQCDIRNVVGNGMACSTMVLAVCPVLQKLGYLAPQCKST